MKPVILMKHVYKSFKDKNVLDNITCAVGECEIFGLLGPHGAGKTTLINILTGQTKASSGRASLFGADCAKLPDEVYHRIGVLSGGVANGRGQRFDLARTAAYHPKLLFLDEPTIGADRYSMREIHKQLRDFKKNGTTVFLATRNAEEAALLCDYVALLNEGVMVDYGEPYALCCKYNTVGTIKLRLKTGQLIELPGGSASAKTIAGYFASNIVESIHTSEPNLDTVFTMLTGQSLT